MHTPMTGIAGLGPLDAKDPARLLGMIVALAGEVFVLKAEINFVLVFCVYTEIAVHHSFAAFALSASDSCIGDFTDFV